MKENTKTPKQMIEALVNSGLKQRKIAEIIGTTPPQVSRILSGQEPLYELGKRIEGAYSSVVLPVSCSH